MVQKRRHTRGVTILEVLIVLSIIALIAAVVGPRLIGYLGRAKAETASLQIAQIKSAMQLYYIDTGRYPTETTGLAALVENPAGDASWRGPYLDTTAVISDPWGRPYILTGTGDAIPTITSLGRDGQLGGEGEDADISN